MVFGDAVRIRERADVMRSRRNAHGNDFPHLSLNMIYMKSFHMSKSRVRRHVVGNLCILNSFSTDSLHQWKR